MGTHGDTGAQRADFILPTLPHTEKEATYVNTDGRVIRTEPVVDKVGNATLDLEIIVDLAKELGIDLGYNNLEGARARMTELAPHLGKVDHIERYNFSKLSLEQTKEQV